MRLGMCSLILVVAVTGCAGPFKERTPPAHRLMQPGPGVGGPGPAVMGYQPAMAMPGQTSQVAFVGPEGMIVNWDVAVPGQFDSEPLVCPGRYNFPQGAIYRLKLTNMPERPGVELYPTLEVGHAMPRTQAFLAHNAIPIQFTEEDFDQTVSGNFVTKVIYLPDPEYQELALPGVATLVSSRLDPGVDPIVEADRRGAILAIVRLGNIDEEMPTDMFQPTEVVPASYGWVEGQQVPGQPLGVPTGVQPVTTPVNYISGMNGPQYGMPMCGTPIGLPGPPHVPLGAPAGLRKHVMRNFTHMRLPQPTRNVAIHVRQQPGMSYPTPANRAWIVEQACDTPQVFNQPINDRSETIAPAADPYRPY